MSSSPEERPSKIFDIDGQIGGQSHTHLTLADLVAELVPKETTLVNPRSLYCSAKAVGIERKYGLYSCVKILISISLGTGRKSLLIFLYT
jgi:hypothetical protein